MSDHALTFRRRPGAPTQLYAYLATAGTFYGRRGRQGRLAVARRLLAELREQHARATVWLDGHRVNGGQA